MAENTTTTTTTTTTNNNTPLYPPNATTGNEEDAAKAAAENVDITVDGGKVTTEQQQEQTQQPQEQPTTAEDKAKAAEAAVEKHDKSVGEIKTALESKGVDFDAIRQEFDENLKLSDSTYDKLKTAGYPKEAVDFILAGIRATADAFVSAAHAHVGGADAFKSIQDFVVSQGDAAIDTFNSVMGSKDIRLVNSYVDGLRAQMTLVQGSTGSTLLTGSAGANTNTGGAQQSGAFQSDAEMVAAMSDPRYTNDPAYRKAVQQKVLASTAIFN